jgi:SNF2 family DNA or RNA helicase
MRLLSEGTIEEGIHQVAQEKLNLEREISNPEGKYGHFNVSD